jgi:hypothetical protein
MIAPVEIDYAGNEVDRSALAKMVMQLLDHWDLPTEDQLALLGLSHTNRSALSRYRNGEPIGVGLDQYARVGHLLGIHKSLRILFPNNKEALYSWIKSKNKSFENRTPVEMVKEFGFTGLLMVRSYLDRARGG